MPKFVAFLFSLCFLLHSDVKSQTSANLIPDSVSRCMDTVFNLIKDNSIYRKNVNWAQLKDSVNTKTKGARTIEDLIPVILYMFESIHDYHGGLRYMGQRYRPTFPPVLKEKQTLRSNLVQAIEAQKARINAIVVDKEYGYISIPGMPANNMEDNERFLKQLLDSVNKLPNDLKGWIIDLRLNTGGSMYPMVNGIAKIIGDGPTCSGIDADGGISSWVIINGKAVIVSGEEQLKKYINKPTQKKLSKVAVLISPLTKSAGESTAIALKGRPNTKFFGESSAGFTNGNKTFQVNKNLLLLVANNYAADRNRHIYYDFVNPDVVLIDGDNFDDIAKDLKVLEAIKWLKEN